MFEDNIKKWNMHLSRELRKWQKDEGLKGVIKSLPPFILEQGTIRKFIPKRLLIPWAVTTRTQLKNQARKMWYFGTNENLNIDMPLEKSDISDEMKEKLGTYGLPMPFVCELENARLYGSDAIGFTNEGKIIAETTVPLEKSIIYTLADRFFSNPMSTSTALELDLACSLVTHWTGYFHWILESLTRIQGLEHYIQQTGRKPKLIIPSNPPDWMLESLSLVGYEPDRCIRWNYSKAQVKRLVVPSFRRNEGFVFSPAACNWLRERVLSNLPEANNEKVSYSPYIYISRQDAEKRRVVNLGAVMKALAPMGFVSYTLSDMNFSEQVRLFSQAEVIVAPHGAGLTNMIWSKQNPIIIELFSKFYTNPVYYALSKTLNFEYGSCQCEPKGEDYIVNVNKLQKIINEIM